MILRASIHTEEFQVIEADNLSRTFDSKKLTLCLVMFLLLVIVAHHYSIQKDCKSLKTTVVLIATTIL